MLYNQILVRFGDLTLKGKNQAMFRKALYRLMMLKMEGLEVEIENKFDRIFIHLLNEDVNKVIEHLNLVSGISSYSLVLKCDNDIETIKEKSKELMDEVAKSRISFKVNTKRCYKEYPLH